MDWMNILQGVLISLIVTVITISAKYLISLIKRGVELLKEKIDGIKDEKFRQYCKDLMQAAETMTTVLLTGADKKDWVTEKLIAYVNEKGLNVPEDMISDMIQSIFKELDGITLNTYKQEKTEIAIEEVINEVINRTISTALLNQKKE